MAEEVNHNSNQTSSTQTPTDTTVIESAPPSASVSESTASAFSFSNSSSPSSTVSEATSPKPIPLLLTTSISERIREQYDTEVGKIHPFALCARKRQSQRALLPTQTHSNEHEENKAIQVLRDKSHVDNESSSLSIILESPMEDQLSCSISNRTTKHVPWETSTTTSLSPYRAPSLSTSVVSEGHTKDFERNASLTQLPSRLPGDSSTRGLNGQHSKKYESAILELNDDYLSSRDPNVQPHSLSHPETIDTTSTTSSVAALSSIPGSIRSPQKSFSSNQKCSAFLSPISGEIKDQRQLVADTQIGIPPSYLASKSINHAVTMPSNLPIKAGVRFPLEAHLGTQLSGSGASPFVVSTHTSSTDSRIMTDRDWPGQQSSVTPLSIVSRTTYGSSPALSKRNTGGGGFNGKLKSPFILPVSDVIDYGRHAHLSTVSEPSVQDKIVISSDTQELLSPRTDTGSSHSYILASLAPPSVQSNSFNRDTLDGSVQRIDGSHQSKESISTLARLSQMPKSTTMDSSVKKHIATGRRDLIGTSPQPSLHNTVAPSALSENITMSTSNQSPLASSAPLVSTSGSSLSAGITSLRTISAASQPQWYTQNDSSRPFGNSQHKLFSKRHRSTTSYPSDYVPSTEADEETHTILADLHTSNEDNIPLKISSELPSPLNVSIAGLDQEIPKNDKGVSQVRKRLHTRDVNIRQNTPSRKSWPLIRDKWKILLKKLSGGMELEFGDGEGVQIDRVEFARRRKTTPESDQDDHSRSGVEVPASDCEKNSASTSRSSGRLDYDVYTDPGTIILDAPVSADRSPEIKCWKEDTMFSPMQSSIETPSTRSVLVSPVLSPSLMQTKNDGDSKRIRSSSYDMDSSTSSHSGRQNLDAVSLVVRGSFDHLEHSSYPTNSYEQSFSPETISPSEAVCSFQSGSSLTTTIDHAQSERLPRRSEHKLMVEAIPKVIYLPKRLSSLPLFIPMSEGGTDKVVSFQGHSSHRNNASSSNYPEFPPKPLTPFVLIEGLAPGPPSDESRCGEASYITLSTMLESTTTQYREISDLSSHLNSGHTEEVGALDEMVHAYPLNLTMSTISDNQGVCTKGASQNAEGNASAEQFGSDIRITTLNLASNLNETELNVQKKHSHSRSLMRPPNSIGKSEGPDSNSAQSIHGQSKSNQRSKVHSLHRFSPSLSSKYYPTPKLPGHARTLSFPNTDATYQSSIVPGISLQEMFEILLRTASPAYEPTSESQILSHSANSSHDNLFNSEKITPIGEKNESAPLSRVMRQPEPTLTTEEFSSFPRPQNPQAKILEQANDRERRCDIEFNAEIGTQDNRNESSQIDKSYTRNIDLQSDVTSSRLSPKADRRLDENARSSLRPHLKAKIPPNEFILGTWVFYPSNEEFAPVAIKNQLMPPILYSTTNESSPMNITVRDAACDQNPVNKFYNEFQTEALSESLTSDERNEKYNTVSEEHKVKSSTNASHNDERPVTDPNKKIAFQEIPLNFPKRKHSFLSNPYECIEYEGGESESLMRCSVKKSHMDEESQNVVGGRSSLVQNTKQEDYCKTSSRLHRSFTPDFLNATWSITCCPTLDGAKEASLGTAVERDFNPVFERLLESIRATGAVSVAATLATLHETRGDNSFKDPYLETSSSVQSACTFCPTDESQSLCKHYVLPNTPPEPSLGFSAQTLCRPIYMNRVSGHRFSKRRTVRTRASRLRSSNLKFGRSLALITENYGLRQSIGGLGIYSNHILDRVEHWGFCYKRRNSKNETLFLAEVRRKLGVRFGHRKKDLQDIINEELQKQLRLKEFEDAKRNEDGIERENIEREKARVHVVDTGGMVDNNNIVAFPQLGGHGAFKTQPNAALHVTPGGDTNTKGKQQNGDNRNEFSAPAWQGSNLSDIEEIPIINEENEVSCKDKCGPPSESDEEDDKDTFWHKFISRPSRPDIAAVGHFWSLTLNLPIWCLHAYHPVIGDIDVWLHDRITELSTKHEHLSALSDYMAPAILSSLLLQRRQDSKEQRLYKGCNVNFQRRRNSEENTLQNLSFSDACMIIAPTAPILCLFGKPNVALSPSTPDYITLSTSTALQYPLSNNLLSQIASYLLLRPSSSTLYLRVLQEHSEEKRANIVEKDTAYRTSRDSSLKIDNEEKGMFRTIQACKRLIPTKMTQITSDQRLILSGLGDTARYLFLPPERHIRLTLGIRYVESGSYCHQIPALSIDPRPAYAQESLLRIVRLTSARIAMRTRVKNLALRTLVEGSLVEREHCSPNMYRYVKENSEENSNGTDKFHLLSSVCASCGGYKLDDDSYRHAKASVISSFAGLLPKEWRRLEDRIRKLLCIVSGPTCEETLHRIQNILYVSRAGLVTRLKTRSMVLRCFPESNDFVP